MTLVWIGSGIVVAFGGLVAHLYFNGPSEVRTDNAVDIAVSPARVFEILADFTRWKRIWTEIAELDPPATTEVGATLSWVRADGRRVDAKIARWDRGACVQLELREVGAEGSERMTLRLEQVELARGTGCRVTLVNELRLATKSARVWVPLTSPARNFAYRGVLWRLKVEAEAED